MPRPALVAAAVAGVLALGGGTGALLAALDDSDESSATLSAERTPSAFRSITPSGGVTVAPSPTGAPSAPRSPTPTAAPQPPDVGYLVGGKKVSGKDGVVAELSFDKVQFLTGKEAEAAAARNNEEVTNDYYVVNDNPRLRTLLVRGDARIVGDSSFNGFAGDGTGAGQKPRTLDELLRFVATEQGRQTFFDLTYDAQGRVRSVVERFVP